MVTLLITQVQVQTKGMTSVVSPGPTPTQRFKLSPALTAAADDKEEYDDNGATGHPENGGGAVTDVTVEAGLLRVSRFC